MRKKLFQFVPLLSLTLAITMLLSSSASAAFTSNNLMDESFFDNYNNMTINQINGFLNTFPNSCISTNSGFESAMPTGYTPSGGFTYGGYVSAGDTIATAAKVYEINPRVLIATLEKEQSLVTGQNSSTYCLPSLSGNHKYAAATGYGCPDSVTTFSYTGLSLYRRNGIVQTAVSPTCVNGSLKAGFSQQVIRAAWLLKFGEQRSKGNLAWNIQKPGWDNSDDPISCYAGPMTQGSRKRCPTDVSTVPYDGITTIDGVQTHMDNGSTAALYWYTPHFHGNQLFVSIYEGWFGPTKGVDYSWSFGGISFSTGSSTVIGNKQVTVTVSAINTGNQSWSDTTYPIRLATFAPAEHDSALYDSSWVAPHRLATVSPSLVLPGGTGTFTFKANIPNNTSIYNERFNLVAEGSTWMPDPDFSIEFNITKATYKWQMVSQSSTNGFNLRTGQASQFTLVVKNTGNTTWNNSTNPVRLGTWNPSYRLSTFNPNDSSWFNQYRAATLQEASVAPGQNGTFIFNVKAPNKPGFYAERFNLVMEGVSWFDDPWMEFDVSVI
jgi:hypothetical protein